MKKLLIPIFAATVILSSCSSKADREEKEAAQRSVDSMKMEMVRKQTIDSVNAANAAAASAQLPISGEQPLTAAAPVSAAGHSARHHSGASGAHNTYTTNNNTYTSAPAAAAPTPEQHKKGWSAKATGAVIGTGVGALTGAVVDKRRGEGAIIGGVVGAAAGLGTGAIIDKKKGR